MLTDYILPGDRIELKSNREGTIEMDGFETEKVYFSEVTDVISDDHIEIMMPMEKGKMILLPVNGEFNIAFYSKRGLFQCDAVITDRYRTNNLYLLSLDLVTNLQKLQRRAYYRFGCALEVKTRELTEYETLAVRSNPNFELNMFAETSKGVIINISGGGMYFVSSAKYEENTMIFSLFSLDAVKGDIEFRVCGRILSAKAMENRDGMYEYRVQFHGISNSDRESIIHYIFEKERKSGRSRM